MKQKLQQMKTALSNLVKLNDMTEANRKTK